MSKRLKSFHKLFFIVLFSILFSGVIGSSSSPDLPEKIAPELEQIEALPRRTKPAELNIEVTKIKSEPLEEVYIDRKTKNIYVDFSKKRERGLRGVRNAEDLEKKYNLNVSEKVQSSGEVVGKGRTKMAINTQVMTYETAELDGKKMLKIPYENEPEKLYISVQENNQVIKIYSLSIKNAVDYMDLIGNESPNFYQGSVNGIFKFDKELIILQKHLNFSYNSELGPTIKEGKYGGDGRRLEFVSVSGALPGKHKYLTDYSEKSNFVRIYTGRGSTKVQIDQDDYIVKHGTFDTREKGTGDKLMPLSDLKGATYKIAFYINNETDYISFQLYDYNMLNGINQDFTIEYLNSRKGNPYQVMYRAEFKIDIPDNLSEPGMVRANNLNEFIIEDDIISEKYKVVSEDLGTLTMQQTKGITSGNLFPFIALGTQTNWNFISSSSAEKNAPKVDINYKNNLNPLYTLDLNMFLEKTTSSSSGTSIKVKNNNKYSSLGIFSSINKLEFIENSLKANLISLDDTLNNILTNFRTRSEREILLTPQGDISNQISYVIGDYTNSLYNVPTTVSLSNVDKKIENIKYPNMKIVKPLLEENVTLTIPSTYDTTTPILFSGSGINSGLTITSDKNRYLKSLHYASSFNINEASKTNIDNNGNSISRDVTLDNGNGVMALKVQYEGRYPKFQILGLSKSGEYTMVIKHFDPSGLERLKYIIKINASLEESSGKEFKVTSSIRDIIIFENGDIEMPTSWVKITQLVENEDRFPIIAINSSTKWKMDTNRPLNSRGNRPKATLKLGDKSLEIPINIRETPYQNIDKFFIYDRGDMTNRNIATGAYSISSKSNAGKNNIVEVDFQMFLETKHIDEIIEYGKTLSGDNNVIEYDETQEDPHIYGIKGILKKDGIPIFKVDDEEILKESNSIGNSIIKFPRIIFSKNPSFSQNTAVLNFINPVPKTVGDISGTFDLIFGEVSPNNLQGYSHPASLTVSGTTSLWNGFTIIPEYHKVKIYVGSSTTAIKEFTTTERGEMKGAQAISSNGNEYILMQGVNSPIAIGVNRWNFKEGNEKITLEHISNNRVVAKDVYNLRFEQFSPTKYLDSINSTFIQKVGTNKDITVTANARQNFIDLGNLKLQNYQKDITKTNTDSIGVQIGVDTTELSFSSIPAGVTLKGKLEFDDGKISLTNPNEIGNLKFIITSPDIDYDNIVGKTFVLNRTSTNPLVFIKGGEQQNDILNKLTITLQDDQTGELPEMSFVSTLNSKTVSENDLVKGTTVFNLPGSVTLKQLTGGQGNSVPVIAIGDHNQWNLSPGNRLLPRVTRTPIIAKYRIGNLIIDVEPELLNPIFSIDGGKNIYGDPVSPEEYKETTTSGKILTALTYVTRRDAIIEKVSTGIKLNIKSEDLPKILEELKKIPGDRVELKPLSDDKTNSNNQAKIAYIHGRDKGKIGDSSGGKKLYIPTNKTLTTKFAYELLPSIFIEKEKFCKNIEINFLPAYKLNDEIKFTSPAIILPAGGVEVRSNNDFKILEDLNYKHKIRITLPDGITETYETTDSGSLITPIVKTIEKNGKTITLFINYTSWNETIIKLTNRIGSQYFDIKLEHIDIVSEDIRRTTNIRINSGVEGSTAKLGEMDFVISSRYNATETPGQLISNPLAITSTGITYQTEVLDLKLLNGDFPEAPGAEKSIEVKDSNGTNTISIITSGGDETIKLTNGTILKLTKTSSGYLKIKPLKWNYNATDKFILTYKNGTVITNQYTFNVICPEFFVASVGVLDFGKIYKIGNPADKTVTTNIELEYKDGTVEPTYSLDVSQSNPNDDLTNWLYLNDEKTLLVEDLHLGSESGEGNSKRILPLTGTVKGDSVKKTNPGVYQKTIQILIHLK